MQPDPWSNSFAPVPTFNRMLPEMGCLPPTAPISVSTYVNTVSPTWAHTVPSPMPWGGVGDPRVAPHPFTAPDPCTSSTATSWELLNSHLGGLSSASSHHLKRKGDPEECIPEATPRKLCITEERMAARFQEMRITNQFALPSEGSTPSITNINQLDCLLKEADSSSPSLVLAPELKKLVEPEKIFASTFLSKVERPSMALVLWQPQKTAGVTERENEAKEEHLNTLQTHHLLSNLHAKDEKETCLSPHDVEMENEETT